MFELNDCPYRPDLVAFLDEELEGHDLKAVYLHLEQCPECAAERRELEDLTLLLRIGDPAEPLPGPVVQRLGSELLQRAKIDLRTDEAPPRVVPRTRFNWFPTLRTLGPAIAAVLLVVWWSHSRAIVAKQMVGPVAPPPIGPIAFAPLQPEMAKSGARLPAHGAPSVVSSPNVSAHYHSPAHEPMRKSETPHRPAGRVTSRSPLVRTAAKAPAERIVIDISGSAELPAPRVSHVTLIASGSPDSPDGETVVTHTEVLEVTP